MDSDDLRKLRDQRNRFRSKMTQRRQPAAEETVNFKHSNADPREFKRQKAAAEKCTVVDPYEGSSELDVVQQLVACALLSPSTIIPIDLTSLTRKVVQVSRDSGWESPQNALKKLSGSLSNFLPAVQTAINAMTADYSQLVRVESFGINGVTHDMLTEFDREQMAALARKTLQKDNLQQRQFAVHSRNVSIGQSSQFDGYLPKNTFIQQGQLRSMKSMEGAEVVEQDLELLLSKKSFREAQKSETGEQLLELIQKPTAKQSAVAQGFKSKGGSAVREYCPSLTPEDCCRANMTVMPCHKMHFRRIIAPHTDLSLGDCSFLDTCRHMKTCKYVHYEIDTFAPHVALPVTSPGPSLPPAQPLAAAAGAGAGRGVLRSAMESEHAQWINCDVRKFPMEVLGEFGVIMADPPWDIHMELPYGTMSDDEMRSMNIQALQKDGIIFLWVTGRAMELGRECLELWGYRRVEELIWVKTNQLQRIIRTGRTGHWLNHSKEHCLIGMKGRPAINRNIDTDVLVAEVRETSRKPDELYSLLERLSPNTRKIEIFARMHNKQKGWVSLGNQLDGVHIVDPELRKRFRSVYPEVEIQPPERGNTSKQNKI